MDVSIKKFNVNMDVKNKGIEFSVDTPNGGGHRGDLIVTKARLEWCNGQVQAGNGKQVTWDQFIAWMNAQP